MSETSTDGAEHASKVARKARRFKYVIFALLVPVVVVSVVRLVVGIRNAPETSGALPLLIACLAVCAIALLLFVLIHLPAMVRVWNMRKAEPGVLAIYHADFTPDAFDVVRRLFGLKVTNRTTINQSLGFSPSGMMIYRGFGSPLLVIPRTQVLSVQLERRLLITGVYGWVFSFYLKGREEEERLSLAFSSKKYLAIPREKKLRAILEDIKQSLNIGLST